MTNHSTARARRLPCGKYAADYQTYLDKHPQTVCDARLDPVEYPTEEKATIAAYEALLAAIERVEAIHLDPGQVKRPAQPKTKAGRFARAESLFKERAET